jgi:hypothetical protein
MRGVPLTSRAFSTAGSTASDLQARSLTYFLAADSRVTDAPARSSARMADPVICDESAFRTRVTTSLCGDAARRAGTTLS